MSGAGNPIEMAHFAQLARSWWDPQGPQRILHKMNLMRMDFITETMEKNSQGAPGYSLDLLPKDLHPATQTRKVDVLDIGCGGGLLSESLARMPSVKSVLGIDVTPEVIEVAQDHKKTDPMLAKKLSYQLENMENLDPKHKQFDLVTMFEVLEHLDSPSHGLDRALSLVKPGGWMFLSTINRTMASYLSTIFLGEYVLNIVPRGTHTWSKYINESELRDYINDKHSKDWQVARLQGCVYLPTQGWLRFDPMSAQAHLKLLNCCIGQEGGNYIMALHRKAPRRH